MHRTFSEQQARTKNHKFEMPTASEMRKSIMDGVLTPSAILEMCIETIDQYENDLGVWMFLDRVGARRRAKKLDGRISEGVLHGIPFGIKDNIDTCNMPTDYGTPIYDHSLPPRDAACVAGLQLAGANPLGKTVCTEFAHYSPGRTRNPWNLDHTPGGSSSGSAAAVASGMVPIALGTQTTGSVIRPAAFCGVIGYKPTFGDFNVSGVLANTPSFDTVGVMANCIADIALVRKALLDQSIPEISEGSLVGARVGIGRTPHWDQACSESQDLIENSAIQLEKAGAVLSDFDGGIDLKNLETAGTIVSGYEFARTLTHERRTAYDRLSTILREGRMTEGLHTDYASYVTALRCIEKARLDLDDAMLRYDFVISPSAPGGAPNGLNETGSPRFNSAWTWLHAPVITLPMATNQQGLPLGLQMSGRRHNDDQLLSFAEAVFQKIRV